MGSMFSNASAFDQELGWCQSGIVQVLQDSVFMGTECQSDNCGVTFAESCPTAEPVECCSCKKGKNKKAAKKNAKKKKNKKLKGKNK